ncbi:TadE family protein [Ruicaihuangia caeni]|uniref:Pilus assembly protein n=1 Tax=Ruicaihuangia caeni TaxID=3042517 RepID=A0AAW6T840_9MICO|nr:TadE family protein [Klugiella sp. YN-L-19]MDI2099271.1 pilus assembly protein [Klugiella sp. YN-L-19]
MRSPSLGEGSGWRRLGDRPVTDRGAVAAEFVAVMPAVIVMLLVLLTLSQYGVTQLRLQDAAAVAVRAVVRGDPVPDAHEGHRLEVATRDGLVCVRASAAPQGVTRVLPMPSLSAESCASKSAL